MKKSFIIITNILLIFTMTVYGQKDKSLEANINVYARYNAQKNMDLVFIADKKHLVINAMQYGFIIERADNQSQIFHKIATVKAYNDQQWKDLIKQEKNIKKQQKLKAGYAFYKAQLQTSEQPIDLNEGIAQLKKRKSDDDMSFLIMLLMATKDQATIHALGLTYTDKTVQVGKTYQYKVKLVKPDAIFNTKSTPITVSASQKQKNYQHLFYVSQNDKKLEFIWNEIPGLQGFDIERAQAGSQNFVKLNNAPIYAVSGNGKYVHSYIDKNLINYKKYTYRFYADNFFGDRVKLFEMTTFSVDKTPPPSPNIQKPEHINPNEVLITWKMPKSPKDLKGFVVARSHQNKGKFNIIHKQLLPPTKRRFIDTKFDKSKINYYIIQAIDTANNISSSAPFSVVLIDSIPPVKPIIASAVIDSLGHIVIKIKPNPEKDLMGYRLFKSNSSKHEFSAIREHFLDSVNMDKKKLHIFKDTTTLNTLTPKIYYRLKALDFHYNQSDFSDIIAVKRPDTIPPTTPVFKSVQVFKDRVDLQFALSESEDVKKQYIYRRTSLQDDWELLSELPNDKTEYIDKKVEQETKYYYCLRAKDNTGLYSAYSISIYATPFDDKVRPPVNQFNVKQKDRQVNLSWKYPSITDATYFIIYKNDRRGNLVQYKKTNKTKFTDTDINARQYTYAVKVFTNDGGESKLCDVKSIIIE